MLKGRIFDIKRYAGHDGPGIRTTVFFKGCPLRCLWCHNPEGMTEETELMVMPNRCIRCYSCISACPRDALTRERSGAVSLNRTKCDPCGRCIEVCFSDALQLVGRDATVDEVVAEVERDNIFYEQSGGGVTFSGGEPLEQPEFLESLLNKFKKRNIHTALDTSGFAPSDLLEKVARKTDLFLYDLKMVDPQQHRTYTGFSNVLILDNLRLLLNLDKEVWIRIPLAAGVNDDEANIRQTADFLKSLKKIKKISLLPYHRGGQDKSHRLGTSSLFKAFEPPSKERYEEIRWTLEESGFEVKRGG